MHTTYICCFFSNDDDDAASRTAICSFLAFSLSNIRINFEIYIFAFLTAAK